MVVLISACRVSGGQLFGFSFSHRCASVVRMSACSFCCSLTRWFRLFLFNQFFFFFFFFCGVCELLVQGVVWHPLHLFCMDQKFGLSPSLKWFNSSGLLHFSYRNGFHGTTDCPQADILNIVQSVGWCASWLLAPKHWPHIPEMVGLLPYRRFFRILELAPQCVPDNFYRTVSFLVHLFFHVLYVWLP